MVTVLSLWLPILLSAIAVFMLSSVIHTVLGYHANDYVALPQEDAVMDALRPLNIAPGQYIMPKPKNSAEMKTPEFQERWKRGPAAMITILPGGTFGMGKQLASWFVYCLGMSVLAAYIAGRALGPGAEYMAVFRFAGATAFIAYGAALWQQTIWYAHSPVTTLKSNFDALLYALVTAGFFGWLWPQM